MTRTHPPDPAAEGVKLSGRDERKKREKEGVQDAKTHAMPRTEAVTTAPYGDTLNSHLPLLHVTPCPPGLTALHQRQGWQVARQAHAPLKQRGPRLVAAGALALQQPHAPATVLQVPAVPRADRVPRPCGGEAKAFPRRPQEAAQPHLGCSNFKHGQAGTCSFAHAFHNESPQRMCLH